jgi:integrase
LAHEQVKERRNDGKGQRDQAGKSYSVVLDLGRDKDGKRIRKWHGGYLDEDSAEKARTELLGRLDNHTYVPNTKTTVRQFAEQRWLPALDALVASGKLRPNTVASYRNQMNAYVIPNIGHVGLRSLSPDRLSILYGELAISGRRKTKDGAVKGLAPTSVRLVHITIHRMLRDALKWGLVTRNVADLAASDVPRRASGSAMQTWSPEQLRTFLEPVSTDRLRAMWVLMITTGLRRGEIAGLRWSSLDLDAGRLRVSNTRVVVNFKVVESGPKTEKSGREIALDPETVTVLRSHLTRQKEKRLARGTRHIDDDLVFTWEDGSPIHPEVISKTFQRLAKAAKLQVIRLHDLRHSYATASLEAGVSLKVVQERLGHGSIAVTADVYSHVRPEIDQAAADKVAGLILGAG